jgi:hypothetical protein
MGAEIPMPFEMVQSISELRFPVKADQHLQSLMDRNTEGLLSTAEREELEGLVELSETLSLLRARALVLLKRRP